MSSYRSGLQRATVLIVMVSVVHAADSLPSVRFSLTTDRASYNQGEVLKTVLIVTNNGRSMVEVSDPEFDLATPGGGRLQVQNASGRTGAKVLRPGESMRVLRDLNTNGLGFRSVSRSDEWYSGEVTVVARVRTLTGGAAAATVVMSSPRRIQVHQLSCADLTRIRSSFGQQRRGATANEEVIDVRVLAAMARQLPAGTVCK